MFLEYSLYNLTSHFSRPCAGLVLCHLGAHGGLRGRVGHRPHGRPELLAHPQVRGEVALVGHDHVARADGRAQLVPCQVELGHVHQLVGGGGPRQEVALFHVAKRKRRMAFKWYRGKAKVVFLDWKCYIRRVYFRGTWLYESSKSHLSMEVLVLSSSSV